MKSLSCAAFICFGLYVAAEPVLAAGGGRGLAGGRVSVRTYGSPSGFGNILFPGTGNPPPLTPFNRFPVNPFLSPRSSFADRLGATISGSPGYTGAPVGRRHGKFAVPVPYPVFFGGYESYPYQQQPNVTVVYPAPSGYAAAPPQVTINQNFGPETARPRIREYGPSTAGPSAAAEPEETGVRVYDAPIRQSAPPDEDQVLFLIALKDSSVYSAVGYWVQGEVLHYITPQGKHNQVSLSLVDREISNRLNQGRKVEFRLPAQK
jgi:hypothetical protein